MFQTRLKQLREDAGYKSQQSFADKFGVSQAAVGNWEAGTRKPDINTLIKLADFFRVSVDYLIGHSNYDGPVCTASRCWDGHHIREIRKQLGETPDETAKCIGISVSDYLKYENAQIDPPVSVLHRLADHFCCGIDWLLEYVWGIYDSTGKLMTDDFKIKSNDEQHLVEHFRLLSPMKQGSALGYIDGLLAPEDSHTKNLSSQNLA